MMRTLKATSFFVLFMSFLGCGVHPTQNGLFYNPSGLNSTANSGNGGTSLTSAQRCSLYPNLLASQGSANANLYRVCRTSQGSSILQVFPADNTQKNICAFPAQGTYSNGLAYQCVSVSSNGGYLNFTGTPFNALYIVDASKLQAMSTCLQSGNIGGCAVTNQVIYSYGQI